MQWGTESQESKWLEEDKLLLSELEAEFEKKRKSHITSIKKIFNKRYTVVNNTAFYVYDKLKKKHVYVDRFEFVSEISSISEFTIDNDSNQVKNWRSHYSIFDNNQLPFEFDITTRIGRENFLEIVQLYYEFKKIVDYFSEHKLIEDEKLTMLMIHKRKNNIVSQLPRVVLIYGLKFLDHTDIIDYRYLNEHIKEYNEIRDKFYESLDF